jgi:hypothetical protein
MSISRLRLENSSIFNYMKYEVISPQFTEQATNESLSYNSSTGGYVAQSSYVPSPISDGRGWVFFDDTTVNGRIVVDASQEQNAKVTVTGASSYTINYLTGAIHNPNGVPTAVSYYWNYVSVISYWPGTNPPPLPFISMSIDSNKKEGFQLGGGVKNVRKVYFDIFASSASERDDLSDAVHSALFNRTITMKDFSDGNYLNYDGTFNTNLSYPLDILGNVRFIEIEHKNLHSVGDWSDLQKYRSIVSGTYESYVDSV